MKRSAFHLPICQSIVCMMTDAQWDEDDGLLSDVMERHSDAEDNDVWITSRFGARMIEGMTPAAAIRSMFPEDFADDNGPLNIDAWQAACEEHDDDDDLPDPATMDWECPYWADPEVDDDLLIAARLHREHRLSLGLED